MSASKQRGLGKGLGAFFDGPIVPLDNEPKMELAVNKLIPNPQQPRKLFDADKLGELVDSIKQHGVIQPLIVRQVSDTYEIVAGERRWRAAKIAGLVNIPVVVRDYTDEQIMEIAIIENIQRHDLNPIEEALAFRGLMEALDLTQEEVAQKIGRSRSAVANVLRLLNLPEEIQDCVSRGTLNMGQVRPLLALTSVEQQLAVAQKIMANEMSAREVEAYIRSLGKKRNKPAKEGTKDVHLDDIQDRLALSLGTAVKIKTVGNKGKILIDFYSQDDLERLLEIIMHSRLEGKNVKTGGTLPV